MNLDTRESAISNASMEITKRSSSLVAATGVTVGLLFIMTQLIDNDMPVLEKETTFTLPPISMEVNEPEVEIIQPIRPELEQPPAKTKKDFSYNVDADDNVIDIGQQDITDPTIEPETIGLPGGSSLVPISPQYPERAAQRGLCGHALVQFDISTDGIPVNVAVVSSSNAVFNKNAVQAVKRARYKPLVEGGRPTVITGKQEKIVFRLEGGC